MIRIHVSSIQREVVNVQIIVALCSFDIDQPWCVLCIFFVLHLNVIMKFNPALIYFNEHIKFCTLFIYHWYIICYIYGNFTIDVLYENNTPVFAMLFLKIPFLLFYFISIITLGVSYFCF
jgi:hypothetical protein